MTAAGGGGTSLRFQSEYAEGRGIFPGIEPTAISTLLFGAKYRE